MSELDTVMHDFAWENYTIEFADKASAELAALRSRVAELEASRAELMAQLAAFGNADAPNGETRTPRKCGTCVKLAEQMREACLSIADGHKGDYSETGASVGYDIACREIAADIRALPLPTCGTCNPLAPSKPVDSASKKLPDNCNVCDFNVICKNRSGIDFAYGGLECANIRHAK